MDSIPDSEIKNLIQSFERERKRLFDLLGKDLEIAEEKLYSQQMKTVESISSNLLKLKKLRK